MMWIHVGWNSKHQSQCVGPNANKIVEFLGFFKEQYDEITIKVSKKKCTS